MRALFVLVIHNALQHIVASGLKPRKIWVLREIGDKHTRLHKPLAAIGISQSGGNSQQRRLARPVAPDKAQARAVSHGQVSPLKQGRHAIGQMNILQIQYGRGGTHASVVTARQKNGKSSFFHLNRMRACWHAAREK